MCHFAFSSANIIKNCKNQKKVNDIVHFAHTFPHFDRKKQMMGRCEVSRLGTGGTGETLGTARTLATARR